MAKVKVRIIRAPYLAVSNASLQAVLSNVAKKRLNRKVGTTQLYDIMAELEQRREASGSSPFRSNEEAWQEFLKYYAPPGMFKLEKKMTVEE